jgi:hypothetical protein
MSRLAIVIRDRRLVGSIQIRPDDNRRAGDRNRVAKGVITLRIGGLEVCILNPVAIAVALEDIDRAGVTGAVVR